MDEIKERMKSLRDVAPDLGNVVAPGLAPESGGGAVRGGGLGRRDPGLGERRKSMEMETVRASLGSPLRKKTRMATKTRPRTAVRVLRKTPRAGRNAPSPRKWSLRRRA